VLLVDDLLLAPITGFLWVFRKIHEAAQEEMLGEADAITQELRELYMMLETGKVTEAEFGDRERTLLDRLEAIQGRESEPEQEDEDEEGEADEEEGENAGEEE
jgi:hypothetical protein